MTGPAFAEAYLADLVAAARAVLGDDLYGAYGAGSIGLNAFQPGRSDIDVALVCAEALDLDRKRALVGRMSALPVPARGLELVVYRRAVAASGTAEPGFEVELNTGPAMPFRATYAPAERPAADGHFWYGLDRSILHQAGRALFGPPAATVFADLPVADLHQLLAETLRWWLDRATPTDDAPAPGAEDAVLGACRALVKVRDGRWLAKVAAGEQLLAGGLADAGLADLVRRSIAARSDATPPGGQEARAFQRRVLAEIAAT